MFRFGAIRVVCFGAALSVGGCLPSVAGAPVLPEGDSFAAVPGEDGSTYVMVESDGSTPPSTMRTRWKRVVNHACQGDYIPMSDGAHEIKRNGKRSRRVHEGWVRCVSPEANDALEEPKPARRTAR